MEDGPDLLATVDQAVAEIGQVARVVAAYWRALVAEGLPEREATWLAQEYQRGFLPGGGSDGE